jgi:predicted N-acetyltransferase YhbS
LIRYRPFLNRDPPALAALWRTYTAPRSVAQPMTAALFESTVLSRPYFENSGLIVALDDDQPVGFAHVGHGPNEAGDQLLPAVGILAALVVRPEHAEGGVPSGLLARAEELLRDRGVKAVHALGYRGRNPFYMGLLGGSEALGVPDSDPHLRQLLYSAGYAEWQRYAVLHRDLASFRPAVSRQQMQLRRASSVDLSVDVPPATWWEACCLGDIDRWQCRMCPREGGAPCGEAMFLGLDHLSQRWGVRTVGLANLRVDPGRRRQGLATCLLAEGFKQLQDLGFAVVEGQVPLTDAVSLQLLRRLGFVEVEQGGALVKEFAA